MISIAALRPGEKGKLLAFGDTDTHYRQRLLAMGVTRGCVVTVIRVAPLGCPVQVQVRGTAISLRIDEACSLLWERV